ncbi:hypothetical protein Nepgr_016325 [Nepenthes gracilis]|uniref:Uncharacterized protein n=1 Tax=Nepenthes gracilis TaxID=150966 RepID=A0AAD3SPI9_NEPGR|nr:hypothetical protein Nepgr_016325 [Nepenthes gracilis]
MDDTLGRNDIYGRECYGPLGAKGPPTSPSLLGFVIVNGQGRAVSCQEDGNVDLLGGRVRDYLFGFMIKSLPRAFTESGSSKYSSSSLEGLNILTPYTYLFRSSSYPLYPWIGDPGYRTYAQGSEIFDRCSSRGFTDVFSCECMSENRMIVRGVLPSRLRSNLHSPKTSSWSMTSSPDNFVIVRKLSCRCFVGIMGILTSRPQHLAFPRIFGPPLPRTRLPKKLRWGLEHSLRPNAWRAQSVLKVWWRCLLRRALFTMRKFVDGDVIEVQEKEVLTSEIPGVEDSTCLYFSRSPGGSSPRIVK